MESPEPSLSVPFLVGLSHRKHRSRSLMPVPNVTPNLLQERIDLSWCPPQEFYLSSLYRITQDETETPSSPGYDHSKWTLATGEPDPDLRLAPRHSPRLLQGCTLSCPHSSLVKLIPLTGGKTEVQGDQTVRPWICDS